MTTASGGRAVRTYGAAAGEFRQQVRDGAGLSGSLFFAVDRGGALELGLAASSATRGTTASVKSRADLWMIVIGLSARGPGRVRRPG